MIKITKKEFENTLSSNESFFFALTKKIIESEELQSIARKILEDDKNGNVEWRTAKKYSNGLKFSTGSFLDTYSKYSKHAFFKENCDSSTVYIVVESWYDNFDDIDRYKYLYYLIKN